MMLSEYSSKTNVIIPAINKIYIKGLLSCSKNIFIFEKDFFSGILL